MKTELPPARLSVDDVQEGRYPCEDACRIEVSLNGEVQSHVTAYDVEAGWIDRFSVDEMGGPVLSATGDVVHGRVSGAVTAVWRSA